MRECVTRGTPSGMQHLLCCSLCCLCTTCACMSPFGSSLVSAALANDVRRLGALEYSFSMLPLGGPPRHAKMHAEVRSQKSCAPVGRGSARKPMRQNMHINL
uniref:Putative secreted protein n=1 Tax=Ixodes ricinus TaxID=34613 RepID=A0A6B0UFB1_IXORI